MRLAHFWLSAKRFDECEWAAQLRRSLRQEPLSWREQKINLYRSNEEFSGDPPLPVARLTPATGHRVIFLM